MKYVKNTKIILTYMLTIFFLAQTMYPVLQPKSKPTVKPVAKPIAKPIQKPVAQKTNPTTKVTLKIAEPIQLAAPIVDIYLVGTIENSEFNANKDIVIKALNQGESFNGTVIDNTLSLICSDNTRLETVGRFITGPKYLSYQYQGSTEYINVPIQNGTQFTLTGIPLTTPITLTDIILGDTAYHFTDYNHNFINALNDGQKFKGTVNAANGDLTLTSTTSSITATGHFAINPSQISYKSANIYEFKNIAVNYGDTITIQGTKTNNINIEIDKQLTELVLGNKSYTLVSDTEIFTLFNNSFPFTGLINNNGDIELQCSAYPNKYNIIGSITSAANQISYKCTGNTEYTSTSIKPNSFITIQVKNAHPPTPDAVEFIIPAGLKDIQLNGYSYSQFSNKNTFIKNLNEGQVFTGTVDNKGMLSLTCSAKNITTTGTFDGIPKNIVYCANDDVYKSSNPITYGSFVGLEGTASTPAPPVPPVTFNIFAGETLTDIKLINTGMDFSNKSALITALNKGQAFNGIITNGGALTLTSTTDPSSSIKSQGVFLNSDPQAILFTLSYASENITKSVPVTKGALVTIIGPPAPSPTPITIQMPNQINEISLEGDSVSFFEHPNQLVNALNDGQTFTGTITNGALTLKNKDATKYLQSTTGKFNGFPKQILYTTPDHATPVENGDTVILIGSNYNPPILLTIDPFKLSDRTTYKNFNQFITFNIISSSGPVYTPAAEKNTLFAFIKKLSQCCSVGYAHNRYLYGINNGTVLNFFSDQQHANLIATFTLTTSMTSGKITALNWTTDNEPDYIGYLPIPINIPFSIEFINPNDDSLIKFQDTSQNAFILTLSRLIFGFMDSNGKTAGFTNDIMSLFLPMLKNSIFNNNDIKSIYDCPQITISYNTNGYITFSGGCMYGQFCDGGDGFQVCEADYNVSTQFSLSNIANLVMNLYEFQLPIPLTLQNNANDILFSYYDQSGCYYPFGSGNCGICLTA